MNAAPVKAMIMAAGRGERMRPLTDTLPKPLLTVHGTPLMQWHREALARGGLCQLVINTAWLGDRIVDQFGSVFDLQSASPLTGSLLNLERVTIAYSHEGRDFGGALETAGGIVRALPCLGEVFWVMAGDIFAPDFRFTQSAVDHFMASGKLAHLWLVPNPEHNPQGDFGLTPDGLALNDAPQKHTYSTIGLYRATLFAPPYCELPAGNPQGIKAALVHLLRAAIDQGRISAELYHGAWTDVGTLRRLQALNQQSAPPRHA